MANQSGNIQFTAVFDATAGTLTLTNTGVYNPGVSQYSWSVLCPSGAVRTATGQTAVIALPAATDETLQLGAYSITATVNDGVENSSITRNASLSLADVRPSVTVTENYTAPSVVFTDAATYYQPGYTAQSVIRAWSAARGPIMITGSNSTTFDLGTLYKSDYTIKQAAVVTYQKVGVTWLTLAKTYTYQQSYAPYIFPSATDLLDWAATGDDCGCDNGNEADCLRAAIIAYYCAGNIAEAWRRVLKLYREKYTTAYRPVYDGQALAAVAYCSGAGMALSIATQPTGGNLVGGVLTLSVVPQGGIAPYAYQWYNGNGAISNATAASYVATSAGSYYPIVTDAAGANVTGNTAVVSQAALPIPSLSVRAGATRFLALFSLPPDATAIQLQRAASNDPTFAGPVEDNLYTTTSHEYTGLTIAGSGYVRARGKYGSTYGDWTAAVPFQLADTVLAIGGTVDGVDDVSIGGSPTFELHYNRIANPISPNSSENRYSISGTNRGSASFQDDHVGQLVLPVYNNVAYYNASGNAQFTFVQGQPAIIPVS